MVVQPARQSFLLPLRFLAGVALAVALTLLLFGLAMRPAIAEFQAMTLFLAATALVSFVAGYSLYRLGWINRSPRLYWTLLSSYILSALLTFLNVWVTARLMFIDSHDRTLATILLVFAAGIAMALGYFLAATVTDQITALNRGAEQIARGRLSTRVAVNGRDELAELAHSFNTMAEQLERAARRQQELDAMRRNLIAWIGHDLRTPLTSVRAIVEALADGMVDEPDAVDRYLGTAKRDIAELAHLIDDLFEMAQLDAGGLKLERQANSLSDLISDTIESFTEQAARRAIRLHGSVAAGVDPVVMDVRQIGRVLANLVGNAVRHTPAGGIVEISARPVAGGVEVLVRDSGEGIGSEDLPHVFEQFYRGEKSRSRAPMGGAGLGLAIAKGLVEAHGGRIRAESQAGNGALLAFTLPREERTPRGNPLLHPKKQ